MLRLSEIKLPLDHTDAELTEAILKALNVNAEDLLSVKLFKRSYDARKKTSIFLIYQRLKEDLQQIAKSYSILLQIFHGEKSITIFYPTH